MTMHEDEDRLLEMALGLLDGDSEERVRMHLQHCASCREIYRDLERTMHHLTNVSPVVSQKLPELPGIPHRRFAWIRAAAMLAIGFGLGVVAAESLETPSIITVQQQIMPKSPELPKGGYVICDRVDILQSSH